MIVMGVAGSGKSSVGEAFATCLGATYLDGDALHPPGNIDKMSRGVPLTDTDRMPWLRDIGRRLNAAGDRMIIGCSALKRAYRETIVAEARHPVTFIYLAGTRQVIAARMSARSGHFMPTSLLDSQFAALEEPQDDENAIRVDIDQPLDALVRTTVELLATPSGATRLETADRR
ncbi:MAG: gluconokinase [Shinella sp.]|nr:gluconokinase [Shinella sp.]